MINRHEANHPRAYWSIRSALRPLIAAQALFGDSDHQPLTQKRQHQHRRLHSNSFNNSSDIGTSSSSTVPLASQREDEEIDEEPVL